MKLIALALVALATPLHAEQTNSTPAAKKIETVITSRKWDLDLKTRQAVYREDVRVDDPRIELTCEWLSISMPTNAGSGRVDSIIAETNVVTLITDTNRGTVYTVNAARAVYSWLLEAGVTNETLELTGEPAPTIRWPQVEGAAVSTNEFGARRIVLDLVRGQVHAEDHRGTFPNLEGLRPRRPKNPATTNAPAGTTKPMP